MKKLNRLAVFAGAILLSTGAIAQDVQIDDGATTVINNMSHSGTITSTTSSQSSTAKLSLTGNVTLGGTYSGYYGNIEPNSGSTTILNSETFGSYFNIGTGSSTDNIIVNVNRTDGTTLSGGNENSIIMNKYGSLKINKNLTLTDGGILMNSYNDANAPKIYFFPTTTTPKITFSNASRTMKTDEGVERVDVSKNLVFDLTDAPSTSPGSQSFTIATFSGTNPELLNSSSPIVENNNGCWENMSVSVDGSNLKFNATFAPTFQNNFDAYKATLSELMSSQTPGDMQRLLKNYTLGSDATISDNLYIRFNNNYTFGGSRTVTISAGKTLTFQTPDGGTFSNTISFGDMTSQVRLIGTFSSSFFGSTFGGSTAGTIVLGDGSTTSTYTHDNASATKFDGKVSRIVVKANSTLTLSQAE